MPCSSSKVPTHNWKYTRKYYPLRNVLHIFVWFILEMLPVSGKLESSQQGWWSLACSRSGSSYRGWAISQVVSQFFTALDPQYFFPLIQNWLWQVVQGLSFSYTLCNTTQRKELYSQGNFFPSLLNMYSFTQGSRHG